MIDDLSMTHRENKGLGDAYFWTVNPQVPGSSPGRGAKKYRGKSRPYSASCRALMLFRAADPAMSVTLSVTSGRRASRDRAQSNQVWTQSMRPPLPSAYGRQAHSNGRCLLCSACDCARNTLFRRSSCKKTRRFSFRGAAPIHRCCRCCGACAWHGRCGRVFRRSEAVWPSAKALPLRMRYGVRRAE